MKIQALALHGFKSFPDRTRIDLHEGITAIVGPNGCGKSNVADALRWVLGEQRPTAIRGSRMEEAIFGGTEQRRPIHRAEVTLELSNEDGALPVPYSEVSIGRTVYRGGESDYSLNGAACRLRDIQDLCRDTGLGANAYAIIEGRMIDAILSDRAEERRAMFEEAAEIGRYKDRRRTALRRLEQAEADLQRLDDVMAEVQSQVRSLAQQRGRAARHLELRARRLQLEVAVADVRLARVRERATEAEDELARFRERQPSEEAELRTAEIEAESLRLRLAERERERGAAARELDEARRALEERERERLLAAERIGSAEKRIAGVTRELERLAGRREELAGEIERSRAAEAEEEEDLAALREREASLAAEVEGLASARQEAARAEEEARRRLAEVWREMDQVEAEGRATEERLSDRAEELERRMSSLAELGRAGEELGDRGAELERAAAEAAGRERSLAEAVADARETVEARRQEVRELRERAAALEGDLSGDRARASSLTALLSSGAELPGAVAELLQAGLTGVEGALADAIRAPAELTVAVESHLGPYLHAVVVRDWDAVERVRAWLAERDGEEGLLLLPLDPGPRAPEPEDGPGAPLAERVVVEGPGAPWARAFLGGVRYEPDRELLPGARGWVRADGSGADPWGAVRLGQPGTGRGTLRRRGDLAELERRIARREDELREAIGDLEDGEAALAAAEAEADELERGAREAARAREEAEGRREAAAMRLERVAEERGEVETRIAELRSSLEAARERSESSAERLERLQSARETAREALAASRSGLAEAERTWEGRRAELHDLQLRSARREADLGAVRDRLGRAEQALAEIDVRAERLREEAEEERAAMEAGREVVEAGEAGVLDLIEARRRLEARLREAEERLEEGRGELEEREGALREARRAEREGAERRHRLELLVSELRARESVVRERLEAEWDAPLEELRTRVEPPEQGDIEAWDEELEEVRRRLHRLGPVNLLAEGEYESEKERLDFLTEQREDLVDARDDLHDSIRRINRKASTAFVDTFDEVRGHFRRTFGSLFEGGDCDVWLEDPDDPLDSPIEISASPRGKKTQRIHLLSGGERALTALALLFAIYLAKPSPFCLMDEVDAPLDEANVLRFVAMLERFKGDTQFILITHNPRTIEAADWIYGVTMQEPGVSSVVGVQFGEAAGQVA